MRETLTKLVAGGVLALDFARPALDLAIRLYLANVFWKSGLVKLSSWSSTVALFTYEYHVPWLPPGVAAVLATITELSGAVLLALGLGARAGAAALFVLDVVAWIAYPDLGDAALKDNFYWGALLLVIVFHGAGRLSLDHLIRRRIMPVGTE